MSSSVGDRTADAEPVERSAEPAGEQGLTIVPAVDPRATFQACDGHLSTETSATAATVQSPATTVTTIASTTASMAATS